MYEARSKYMESHRLEGNQSIKLCDLAPAERSSVEIAHTSPTPPQSKECDREARHATVTTTPVAMVMTVYININNTFAFYALDVKPIQTIAEVKEKIAIKTGIQVANQRALHHHAKLLDHWTLKESFVTAHAILVLFLHHPAGLLPFVNAVLNGMPGTTHSRSPRWPLITLHPPPDPKRLTFSAPPPGGHVGTAGVEPLLAAPPGRFKSHAGEGALDGRGWRDRILEAEEAAKDAAARVAAEREAKQRGLQPGTPAYAAAMCAAGVSDAPRRASQAVVRKGPTRAQRIAQRAVKAQEERRLAMAEAKRLKEEERAARLAAGEEVTSSDDEDEHATSLNSFYDFSIRRREGFRVSNTSKAVGGASAILGFGAFSRTCKLPIGPNTLTATQRLECDTPLVVTFNVAMLRRLADDLGVIWEVHFHLWGGPKHAPDMCVDASATIGWVSKKGVVLIDASDDSGSLAVQRQVVEADKQRELFPDLYSEPLDDPTNLAYPTATYRRRGRFKKVQQRAMRLRNWRLTITKRMMKVEFFQRQLKQWYPGARYNLKVFGVARPRHGEITLKTGFFIFHAARS